MRIGSILLVVWLLIGLLAAFQRGYLQNEDDVDCATASTTVVTVLAGPLNYVGVNPKIDCDDINVDVDLPEPSQ
jgi:hypothetical protein